MSRRPALTLARKEVALVARSVFRVTLSILVLTLAWPDLVWAQATDLASQRLGPGYMEMFLAYAAAWLLVLGWVVSIARRLAKIERRLQD